MTPRTRISSPDSLGDSSRATSTFGFAAEVFFLFDAAAFGNDALGHRPVELKSQSPQRGLTGRQTVCNKILKRLFIVQGYED
jgi:hypothetical protein